MWPMLHQLLEFHAGFDSSGQPRFVRGHGFLDPPPRGILWSSFEALYFEEVSRGSREAPESRSQTKWTRSLTPGRMVDFKEHVVDFGSTHPNVIDVEQDGRSLAYHELEKAAKGLANRLISTGLEPGQRVYLVVQRSLPMVITMLAVLKCGSQYVPLNGQVRAETALRHIMKDTGAPYVLCLEKFHQKVQQLAEFHSEIIVFDSSLEDSEFSHRSSVRVRKSDGAYAIYTLGSTGPPKGVDVSHDNITNLLCNYPGNLNIRQATKVAQLPSISFDMDEDGNLVPIRNTGLMWVGSAAVSRGYLNLAELALTRYKPDKFLNNGIMFNTGDLCRWRPDGSIAYKGRADDQVKIKGFRVELDSVSVSIEGFYSGSEYNEIAIKTIMEKKQPYYAVPSKFVYRHELPMTKNSKIDKKALLSSIKVTGSTSTAKPVTKAAYTRSASKAVAAIHPGTPVLMKPLPIVAPSEKQPIPVIYAPLSRATSSSSSDGDYLEKAPLPGENEIHGLWAFRYRILSLYRRLFSVVFIANVVAIMLMIRFGTEGRGLQNISTAIGASLATAVLMRQEYLRRNCAEIYHIGGLHSECAIASTIWFVVFTVGITIEKSDPAVLVISYLLVALLISVVASAHPIIRMKYHDQFELIHRFVGWTALFFFWIQTIVVTNGFRNNQTLGLALATNPSFWLLLIATLSVILPWTHLRHIPVLADVLSSHAVRLYFTYTTPAVGTAILLSERPLIGWHAFATIAKPSSSKFSVLVSNAGDWTKRQITKPPTKLWVRGIPACRVQIAPLFRSIVLVATGSGISPCLPVTYAKRVPARIFWSMRHPEQNFGMEVVNAVKNADPDAVIHNTKTMEGRIWLPSRIGC
ncbi:hypothetical protein G7Y89_g14114 [Cudoniella acicularis]|uniref:AMP-dependent synthetase/ligase domain-containing protein n=1 Tax=Cudoniella acicularis TaxID=354080 RepID=A0A8H4VVF3_9HELO|nr:hypothetical protein G7Y89_g14114 [Cudoniella acicularis]